MADRWHCDWCDYKHPVATMVTLHEDKCEARLEVVTRPRVA